MLFICASKPKPCKLNEQNISIKLKNATRVIRLRDDYRTSEAAADVVLGQVKRMIRDRLTGGGDVLGQAARVPVVTAWCKNGSFLSAFPMFVPSLSWQNDPFCIKRGQKVTFSHLGIAGRSGTYNVHDVCTAAASTLIKSLPEVTQRMR